MQGVERRGCVLVVEAQSLTKPVASPARDGHVPSAPCAALGHGAMGQRGTRVVQLKFLTANWFELARPMQLRPSGASPPY